MEIRIQQINRLLPQTQCRECGYDGCMPYAQDLAQGVAEVHLCVPGGATVAQELAQLLNKDVLKPAKEHQNALAWIDEAVCIGCTACIRACPVDAIMGASKYMHTVLSDECTGCGLCVAPCPVDCIHMQPTEATYLPLAGKGERFAAAEHALQRYQNRNNRKQKEAKERAEKIAARNASIQATQKQENTAAKATFNPQDLIAQAMQRAQAQQMQRTVPNNREAFLEQQLQDAKQRATYRRAVRDVQYGDEKTKQAALEWLKAYKIEQEAKQLQNEK